MSLEQLMQEAGALSQTDRRKLIGHLVLLGQSQAEGYWDRVKERIEDNDPAHWATEKELEDVLRLNEQEQ